MAARTMYLYHIEGDRMVMDVASHTDHHRQARRAMGLPKPRYVAGTFVPLLDKDIKKYEAHYKVTFDTAKRKELPPFEEPKEWEGIRAKNAAALAAREVAK